MVKKNKRYGIVLCSGGLDSVTTSYYVKKKLRYDEIIILFFDYGQKSVKKESECSQKTAQELESKFIEMKLPILSKLSTSLINKNGRINKVSRKELKDTREESKNWYVPFRNLVFLSYALALVEKINIKNNKKFDIFLGFKNEGNGGFPDTSLNFMKDVEKIGEYGYSGKFKIKSPLINKDKSDIIIMGKKLKLDFRNTFSCYIGKSSHCGCCLACRLRQEAFYWANIKDPTEYKEKMKDFRLAL